MILSDSVEYDDFNNLKLFIIILNFLNNNTTIIIRRIGRIIRFSINIIFSIVLLFAWVFSSLHYVRISNWTNKIKKNVNTTNTCTIL